LSATLFPLFFLKFVVSESSSFPNEFFLLAAPLYREGALEAQLIPSGFKA